VFECRGEILSFKSFSQPSSNKPFIFGTCGKKTTFSTHKHRKNGKFDWKTKNYIHNLSFKYVKKLKKNLILKVIHHVDLHFVPNLIPAQYLMYQHPLPRFNVPIFIFTQSLPKSILVSHSENPKWSEKCLFISFM